MELKRNLRYGMSGRDVLAVKQQLFELGYYAPEIKAIRKDTFGTDTRAAVRTFQKSNVDEDGKKLRVDGIIGQKTWRAIQEASTAEQALILPDNISKRAAFFIAPELMRAGELRRQIVTEALTYAFDPLVPAQYPHALYIRGGNLYHTDLSRNVITAARIRAGAKRQPQYYDGGRMDMMLEAVRNNPSITGADCSGGIVGLLRRYRLTKPTFDATADMLCSGRYSSTRNRAELRAGDWVGRPGHIGVYAGGGYVVEWMGGAYGCQLSMLDKRQGYSFTRRQSVNQPGWTRFRKPDAY